MKENGRTVSERKRKTGKEIEGDRSRPNGVYAHRSPDMLLLHGVHIS